jgi:hypothetical protein
MSKIRGWDWSGGPVLFPSIPACRSHRPSTGSPSLLARRHSVIQPFLNAPDWGHLPPPLEPDGPPRARPGPNDGA